MKTINVNEEKDPSGQAVESLVSHQQGFKPTARPWHVVDGRTIVSANHRPVARATANTVDDIPNACTNAELIVQAVNSHDALVAALSVLQKHVHSRHCDPHPMGQSELCKIASDALVESGQ